MHLKSLKSQKVYREMKGVTEMKIFKNLRKAYREERKYRDNVMETIDAMGIRGIFMAMFTGKC